MAQEGSDVSPSRRDLLCRILVAELPGGVSARDFLSKPKALSFAGCLEDEYAMTETSARRLEAEYRRFLYLKAVDGGVLTPSRWVDRAWHLHLDAPDGAWNRYCDEVLGQRAQHWTAPSTGESRAGYQRTLDLYRREFGENPPPDIWPGEAEQRRLRRGMQVQTIAASVALSGLLFGTILHFVFPSLHAGSESLGNFLAGLSLIAGFAAFFVGVVIRATVDLETAICG